jgi:hypothetical protein
MKVQFADSFGKSLKRLIWHQSRTYKVYEFFRYGIPRFFKNLWYFRKELYEFRPWDYTYNLKMFGKTLNVTADSVEKYGLEIDETRLKKVEKMRRVVELINRITDGSYIELAEQEIGELPRRGFPEFAECVDKPGYYELVDNDTAEEKELRRKIYKRSDEIEEETWNEMFEILKGQDYTTFNKDTDWNKQFNGSGLRNWWD